MAIKPKGMKFNLYSSLELAGICITALIIIPFAWAAWSNLWARTHYTSAMGYFTGRDYITASKELEKCIESRPETVYAHELLGFSFFELGDLPKAQAAYATITNDPVLQNHERAELAELAQACIKLLRARQSPDGRTSQEYAAAAEQVRKLAQKRAFLEARLVEAQLELDTLAGPNAVPTSVEGRRASLDGIASKLSQVSKELKKKPPSKWGLALYCNTRGIVYFEQGMLVWDEIRRKGLEGALLDKRSAVARELTGKACDMFLRAVQYRLVWTPPFINYERAMAVKLVEYGHTLEDLAKWVDQAQEYRVNRNDYEYYLTKQGVKISRVFDLQKKKNLFTFYNSLAMAHAPLDDLPNKTKGYFLAGLGLLNKAQEVDRNTPLPALHRARLGATMWKRWVGLKDSHHNQFHSATNSARELYKKARRAGSGNADPLRKIRLYNNLGAFRVVAGEYSDVGAIEQFLYKARSAAANQKKNGVPAIRERLARERLEEKIEANIKRAIDGIINHPTLHERNKAQMLSQLGVEWTPPKKGAKEQKDDEEKGKKGDRDK